MPNFPNFPIPSETPDEKRCICLQIPDNEEWIQVFAGLLAIPSYWFNWQRDNTRAGKELAQHWTKLYDEIDWSNMSCCCNTVPIQYRYTVDGELEKSTDGGLTWELSPENDPRYNSPQYPPLSGDDGTDKRCAAAEGMVLLLKEGLADNLTDDMSRYTLDELIKDWVTTVVQTSNPFDALMRVIANQIFSLVISALRAALTTDVYDELQCILYCAMDDDASFTQMSWESVRTKVLTEITGIAGIFIEHILFLLGALGMTNLARSGAVSDGDCSECDCSCFQLYLNRGTEPYEELVPDAECGYTIEAHTTAARPTVYQAYVFSSTPYLTSAPSFVCAYMAGITGASFYGQYNPGGGQTINTFNPEVPMIGFYAEASVPFTISVIPLPA